MEVSKEIELIKLEVLGCLNKEDKAFLRVMKETSVTFPWKTLANYQNLIAFLPSVMKTESPASSLKDSILKKLNIIVYAGEGDLELKDIPVLNEKPAAGNMQHLQTKNKIDWGSISSFDTKPANLNEFKNIQALQHTEKKDSGQIKVTTKSSGVREDKIIDSDNPAVIAPGFKSPFSKKVRYVLLAVILLLISAIIVAYIHFKDITDEMNISEENNSASEIFNPISEESQSEITGEFVDKAEIKEENKNEIKNKAPEQEIILPKPPPKLPDLIELPIIEANETPAKEDSQVAEELSIPPPKEEVVINEEPIYFVAVEEMPEPIGGLQGIQAKIVYPEIAKRAGIEGKVYIKAFIDETGTVTNAQVVKGIGGGCDEAALDAILNTKFTQGKQRGKPIKVQVTIPVVFKR